MNQQKKTRKFGRKCFNYERIGHCAKDYCLLKHDKKDNNKGKKAQSNVTQVVNLSNLVPDMDLCIVVTA